MTRTSWRDDFTRIVKDRAIAYAESDGRYRRTCRSRMSTAMAAC